MGATAEPARGGKRSLDVDVNLVPYIDMLMTIMGFLMLTAVWTRIAALEVQAPSSQVAAPTTPDLESHPIVVVIASDALRVTDDGGPLRVFPLLGDGHDWAGAGAELQRLKQARPERAALQIRADDGVAWETIARLIDLAAGLKLTAVSLEPTDSGTAS